MKHLLTSIPLRANDIPTLTDDSGDCFSRDQMAEAAFSVLNYVINTMTAIPIVKFHSRPCYHIFVTQVIRISRVCNRPHLLLYAQKRPIHNNDGKRLQKHKILKELYICFMNKDLYLKLNIGTDTQFLQTVLAPCVKT